MKFKYQYQFNSCGNCPPSMAKPVDGSLGYVVYRLGGKLVPSDSCFVPPAIERPARWLNKNETPPCNGYAISLFSTTDTLKNQYDKIKKVTPKFTKQRPFALKCIVNSSDGVVTPPSRNGHIDLYESVTAKLENNASVLCKVEEL